MGKDWERFKNFQIFGFWGTDKEFEEAAPIFGCAFFVIIFVLLILWIFGVIDFPKT